MERVTKGLAGVVVDDTAIADVQAQGVLSYRGYKIDQLVDQPFMHVAALVVNGTLDDTLMEPIARAMPLDERETALVLAQPEDLHPMKLLQGVVPLLSSGGALGFGEADQGLRVAAKIPGVLATHLCRKAVTMEGDADYIAAFLRAIGNPGSEDHLRAFNTTQVLQMEHGFNAGTFAARVVASTLAPVEAAIAAGFGALSGPLHGGADEAALTLADGLADPDAARQYVKAALERGEKVPGMGHREYRVVDPRAIFLKRWAEQLAAGTEHEHTYHVLCEIDRCFSQAMQTKGKALHANVEFYKGLVLRVLGLPNQFFTGIFAMARVFGYVAHFLESRQDNRIFRPAAHYVGPQRAP
jgi:citrate synthase